MAQKSLDFFSPAQKKPVKAETKAEASPTVISEEKKERKYRVFPPVAPENLPMSYFVSAGYDGRSRKASLNSTSLQVAGSTSGTTTQGTNLTASPIYPGVSWKKSNA